MILRNNKYFELFLVTANHFTDLLATVIITKLLSTYLTKSEYGFYALILSVLALITILPFSSFHTAIERFIVEYKSKNEYSSFLLPLVSLHLLFFIIYSILSPVIYVFLDEMWKSFYIPLLFFIFTRIYKGLLLCILNIERKRVAMLISRIIDMVIQIFIISYFIYNKNLNIEIILYSSITANTCSLLILLFSIKENISLKSLTLSNFKFISEYVLKYSAPLIIWGFFLWAQNMIMRWYIEYYLSKDDVANYSVMTSLALLPATAIISIVGQFIVPKAYPKENEERGHIAKTNKKILLYTALLFIITIITTYFVKDLIIRLFLDEKYINVSWSLPILMIGTALYTIGQVLIYEIYYYKKPNVLLVANIVPGIFSIIIGLVFIKIGGFNGAIITNLLSFSISGIITYITVLKFSKKMKFQNIAIK